MPGTANAAAAEDAGSRGVAEDDIEKTDEAPPRFGLPPIVVEVLEKTDPKLKAGAFVAELSFDEVDRDRIKDTLSVTKPLLPRIMDSVITGIHGKRFEDLSDLAALNAVVLQRSNAVLNPYGVVVQSSRLTGLGTR